MEKRNSVEEEKGSNNWVTQVVECSMQRETARLLPLKFGVVSGSMTMPVFVQPVGDGLRISRPCPARLTFADLDMLCFFVVACYLLQPPSFVQPLEARTPFDKLYDIMSHMCCPVVF